jgi:hypothetical protein
MATARPADRAGRAAGAQPHGHDAQAQEMIAAAKAR